MNKQIFRIHRITGLIAGVFLLLLSLTGSLLVFSEEIDHALHKDHFIVTPAGKPLSLNALYYKAANAIPGKPYLTFLRLPQAADESLTMRAEYNPEHKVYIYLNPYSGQVLRVRANKEDLTGWMLYLHFTLLAGRNGSITILVMAFVMAIAIITGLFVYRKHLWKVLTFRDKIEWKHRRRRWRNLHRITGVWALLFNIVILVTGILIQFKVVGARVGKPPPAVRLEQGISFDQMKVIAEATIPGFHVMAIRPPRTAGGIVSILGNAGEAAIFGKYSSSVNIQPGDSSVVKFKDFKTAAVPDKMNASVTQLHFGNFGGIGLKILYSLLGLSPGLLSLSGMLIWYRRKFLK